VVFGCVGGGELIYVDFWFWCLGFDFLGWGILFGIYFGGLGVGVIGVGFEWVRFGVRQVPDSLFWFR
jgi:hypothetical protein